MGRRLLFFCDDFCPIFFGVFEEGVDVDIVYEHDPHDRGESREAPRPADAPLHHHQEEVRHQGHPYLELYGIGALPVEVSQREVLLQLLEEQLNLPSLAVDIHNFLRIHVHVVGEEADEAHTGLLDVRVCDDARTVRDGLSASDLLREDHMLYPVRHKATGRHHHLVFLDIIDEVLLHLGDVDDATPCQFRKLRIVDIRPVYGEDVPVLIVGGLEHEAVVRGRGGESHVGRHPLVGMDVGVHLQPALLLSRLRMAPRAFEQEVREEAYCRGVYDLQPAEPFRSLPLSAVRRKFTPIGGIQVAVCRLEDRLRPSGVRIRQRAATRHQLYSQVGQLARLRKHGVSDFPQRVESPDHGIEHDHKMLPRIKMFHIPLPSKASAYFEDFLLVKQIYQLPIHRLSEKMCIFAHRFIVL